MNAEVQIIIENYIFTITEIWKWFIIFQTNQDNNWWRYYMADNNGYWLRHAYHQMSNISSIIHVRHVAMLFKQSLPTVAYIFKFYSLRMAAVMSNLGVISHIVSLGDFIHHCNSSHTYSLPKAIHTCGNIGYKSINLLINLLIY